MRIPLCYTCLRALPGAQTKGSPKKQVSNKKIKGRKKEKKRNQNKKI